MAVGDEGPTTACLVLLGEAPGKWEELHGRPFVGPSGQRLAVWWRRIGLTRRDFYITNVLPWRPPNNQIDAVPRAELEPAMEALHERLAALDDPAGPRRIIIPTGNYALYALTGKGKVAWHRTDGRVTRAGILDWRGSVLTYVDRRGRECLVVPTLHPAFVLRTPAMERRTICDWQKIVHILHHGYEPPRATHIIKPTIDAVEDFVEAALRRGDPVALDIETPKGRVVEYQMLDGTWRANVRRADHAQVARYKSGARKGELKTRTRPGQSYLGCVGIAYDPAVTLTIPMTRDYWRAPAALDRARAAVQRLLDSDVPLVVQNGISFDLPWLRHDGFAINWHREIYDTRAMHAVLDPRDDHNLAYMASTLTNFSYWKHEAKDADEVTKYASNSEALWRYNGIDVAATLTIFRVLRERLIAENLWTFYRRHYCALVPALVDMTLHGIAVDHERRAAELAALEDEAVRLRQALTIDGMPLVIGNGLSNLRLKYLFYGPRGFTGPKGAAAAAKLQAQWPAVQPFGFAPRTKRTPRGERSVTVDEVTVRLLTMRHPDRLGTLGPALLAFRRNRKRAEFLRASACDADGRLRCSYSPVTEAGRLAASETPWGSGRSLQTIDRELRHVFIPDPDPPADADDAHGLS